MKGTNKIKGKKKGKGSGKAKHTNRAHLHSGNRAYNAWMDSHKVQKQPDGYPQGKHDAKLPKGVCRCGECSNKAIGAPSEPHMWFKGMTEKRIAHEALGDGYFA